MSLPFLGRCTLAGLIAFLPIAAEFSQSASSGAPISANDLVRAIVANELKPQGESRGRWMYRAEREQQGKKKAKEVVQTGQGSLDRLVAVDGQPLSAKEQQEEKERIGNLVRNPAEQQKLEQTRKKDAEQCKAFFKMLPDALTFIFASRDGDVIKLNYRPNPSFQPPSREARVFHEMEGELWVHETQRRLVRIRGQLVADVNFAGGLLGHLEKGGHFNVEQRELSPGQWDLTFMEVDMKGKALFFKTIDVNEKEYRSDFRTVPDGLTLAEAAEILSNEVTVAANR
ncbi:MAG: hypothetical protein DMG78_29740 [Acidobacteria bacterium]|nr:MAG: hypothetical protein DMG78_29740 [Acidobacteriota bacterium]